MPYTLTPNTASTSKNTVVLLDPVTTCDYGSHEVVSYSKTVMESSRQSGQITGATLTTTMAIQDKSSARQPIIIKIVTLFQKNTGSENKSSNPVAAQEFLPRSQPDSALPLPVRRPGAVHNIGRVAFIFLHMKQGMPGIILCQQNKNILRYLKPVQPNRALSHQNNRNGCYPSAPCRHNNSQTALPNMHFGNRCYQSSGPTGIVQGNRNFPQESRNPTPANKNFGQTNKHIPKSADLNSQNATMQKTGSSRGNSEAKSPPDIQNMVHRQGDTKSSLHSQENMSRWGLMKGFSDPSVRTGSSMEGKDSALIGRKESQMIRAGGENTTSPTPRELNGKNGSTVPGVVTSLPLGYQNTQNIKRDDEGPGITDRIHGVCFFPDRDRKKKRRRKISNLFAAGLLLVTAIMLIIIFISTY